MVTLCRAGAFIAMAAVLPGCATAPPQPPRTTDAPVMEVPAEPTEIEHAIERRRALALKSEQARDLPNAAAQWQVVLLLAPNDSQAAERLAAVRLSIAKIVKDELGAGRDALRRGDTEQTQQSMLRVLVFDARNEEAVTVLREIDRQRAMRRGAERVARARMGDAAISSRSGTLRRGPNEAREFDLEQSLELLKAGDSVVALAELRRYAAANRRDRATRERIAGTVRARAQQLERQGSAEAAVNMYAEAISMHPSPPREWTNQQAQLKSRLANEEYDKGVRVMASDVTAAIAHFEAALRFVPDHTQAQLRLDRALKIQKNLRAIGPARNAN